MIKLFLEGMYLYCQLDNPSHGTSIPINHWLQMCSPFVIVYFINVNISLDKKTHQYGILFFCHKNNEHCISIIFSFSMHTRQITYHQDIAIVPTMLLKSTIQVEFTVSSVAEGNVRQRDIMKNAVVYFLLCQVHINTYSYMLNFLHYTLDKAF